MQQEQRGHVDETYVPEPRRADHDAHDAHDADDARDFRDSRDDDVAVGTAQAPDRDDPAADRDPVHTDEAYPAGTYASGSSGADPDARADVEVVDRDRALAEEDDDRSATTAWNDDRSEDQADWAADRADERSDERDEVAVAEAEAVEDRRWEADDSAGDASDRADDAADRAWAAEHATQLRAGSLDTDRDDERDDTVATTDRTDEGDDTVATADRDDDLAADRDDTVTAADRADDETGDHATDATDATDTTDTAAGDTDAVAGEDDLDGDGDGDGPAEPEGLLPGAVEAAPIGALWADGAAEGLRERWRELQLRFIDDPRSVAGEADQLVGEAVASITASLEEQRQRLTDWQGEGAEDTERLRAAVRQYRDFLDRLLGL